MFGCGRSSRKASLFSSSPGVLARYVNGGAWSVELVCPRSTKWQLAHQRVAITLPWSASAAAQGLMAVITQQPANNTWNAFDVRENATTRMFPYQSRARRREAPIRVFPFDRATPRLTCAPVGPSRARREEYCRKRTPYCTWGADDLRSRAWRPRH